MKYIKLAYIGGGSKAWARVFMNDLALTPGLSGEIALYDIDTDAARRNQKIGGRINEAMETLSKWNYVVYEDLEEALRGADFVACSILPGTFDEMESDVHAPERFGIYQSVGDTVGPGGVLRTMRTVPIYEGFAGAIKKCCPDAWVINLTNPMTACVKTLYDVFPEIKAFGCCHEVFHAEDFLCCVLKEELGVPRPDRHELTIDASGINHFTWITEATWQGQDVLKLLPGFMEKFYDRGYCERKDKSPEDFRSDPFSYGNKVKMDLYRRFGALGAAGDRHLVEFLNKNWYLGSPEDAKKWLFHLTTVDYRREIGIFNLGGSGVICAGGTEYKLGYKDCLYITQGTREVTFASDDPQNPAKYYMVSAPAHCAYETKLITIAEAAKRPLGSLESCNKRTINQFIHPSVLKTCQLTMGMTALEPGSNWNTMPSHTHERRMEIYTYFEVPEGQAVFHMMGQPTETRHIVMNNFDAVISPSWSIHSGVGTSNYTFIWAMGGENQEFDDMDNIYTPDLK